MREMEKIMKLISKEIENVECNNEEQLQVKLDQIVKKMNQKGYEYDEDEESRSYDMLERAYSANSLKQARELAKRALIIYSDNIDALVFLAELENNESKKLIKLNQAINRAEEILKKDNYFEDSVGDFWGLIETRPYLRARSSRLRVYLLTNKFDEAIEECEDIIRLNENDNMGIRYSLMNLYCFMNKFDDLNKLYKKYEEKSAYMLFPISIMYFKQNKREELINKLKEIKEANKYLIDMLIGKIKKPNKNPEYYSPGSIEEALLIIEEAFYLINDNIAFINFLKENYNNI